MHNLEQRIDALHLEDLRNQNHPSIFDENETYDMLIVRLPVFKPELQLESFGFVITKTAAYLYNRERDSFDVLSRQLEDVHRTIDNMADRLLKSFTSYQERIADMEEMLYADAASKSFLTDWLGLKRDILRIERVLAKTVETMNGVIKYYEDEPTFPINHFIDLHEHLDRIGRSAVLQLSKLDYLYNFYNVRTSEKMNKMVYLLTIISAIFLPLNLVVGFFGMNTGGLPFAEGSYGTFKAVFLMVFLVTVTTLGVSLWRKRVEQ